MRRNKVRNQVSDMVEYEFDKLHRVADRFMIYPLAVVEGAIQGAARGVHNFITHKHPLDRAAGDPAGWRKCNSKPPAGFAPAQPVGPDGCYGNGYPVTFAPPPPPPPAPPQFQYHPAFPVPCRPPN
ncbi:hypothetical protein DITRI_Ditri08aG0006800 [Diplodiscus trichospermus]